MVIKKDLVYPPSGTVRTLHIYLPEGYEESEERYPVMYFFDGHNLFSDSDATYGKSWGLKDFLDGYDKKMIIVGMECSHEGNARLLEYNPYRAYTGAADEIPGDGDKTMKWIVEEIKPMIDAQFRTYSHREATGIGGSSMGGLMAVYALAKYNAVFSKGACISSAAGFCLMELLNDILKCPIDPDTRAFLSWGTREVKEVTDHTVVDRKSFTYRRTRAIAGAFRTHDAYPRLACQLGGGHCEADWEKQIPYFMNFLWKDM